MAKMKTPGTKALPIPKGGRHASAKPRLRARHLAVAAPSAFGQVGAPQAFPDTGGGGAPFDPNAQTPMAPDGGGGAPMPPGGPAGPGPGM